MPSALACCALGRSGVESDDDVVSAVAQVQSLGVALASVSQDGDDLVLQGGGIRVVLVENGGQGGLLNFSSREPEDSLLVCGLSLAYRNKTGRLTTDRPVGL